MLTTSTPTINQYRNNYRKYARNYKNVAWDNCPRLGFVGLKRCKYRVLENAKKGLQKYKNDQNGHP
jgi:hypothetical protein